MSAAERLDMIPPASAGVPKDSYLVMYLPVVVRLDAHGNVVEHEGVMVDDLSALRRAAKLNGEAP